ncbi:MAG: ketoacyl-ACP synthase III [Planctomycetes bacterium]|nr:ketoacyl-ACP synthase III [Planctomycetota bacterium]
MASGYSDKSPAVSSSPSSAASGVADASSVPCRSSGDGPPAAGAVPELSGRGRLSTLMGVQVLATGSYIPEAVVRNEDLATLGCDAQWIVQRTGIQERRRAAAHEATSDLAYEAAVRCLDNAGIEAREIDLILVATMTPDMPTPSTACTLQRRLGTVAAAMDINAACSGFIYALITGMQFVKTGCSRRALVVGSDIMSRIINPADKKTFPLFGDGAGAVVVGESRGDQGLLAYSLGSEGDLGELLSMPGGGSREPLTPEGLARGRQYLRMDGRSVFKWAVRMIQDIVGDVMRHAELTMNDLDLVIMHQANQRILDAAADGLGLDRDKVLMNLDRVGNTTAASIPMVLDEAWAAGRLKRGDHVLLTGFGAGLTWGAAVVRY